MSRIVSLNARQSRDVPATDEVEVVLVIIEHPDLPEPLRISTDNAVRLSDDPLTYGTMSRYGSNDGLPKRFYFIGMSAILPDDEEEAEATSALAIDVLETGVVTLLTTTTTKATCRMAVVLSSTPDLVEREITGLLLENASGDWGQVQINFSMQHLYDEPYPAIRFSKQRFPGLFK